MLPARREGLGRIVKVDLEDLRRFAKEYGYDFNEVKAARYTAQ
jgi:hypothetical protein